MKLRIHTLTGTRFGLALAFLSLPLLIHAQALVRGIVTDPNGQGLPGVNILEKGASNGVVSDIDGAFQINVAPNATLVFSYIGFAAREEPVGGRSFIEVTLEEDASELQEVVVVGYGTQRRRDLTGAIASVSNKEITRIPVSGFDQALQGQVPGLQISSTSGAPGGNTNILVRGVGSISGGVEPLIVIDGFPINNAGVANPLNTINPADIESIEVLKDASATAIYGSRGSNGVIIITTKRGIAGQAKVELDVFGGFQQVSRKMDMMNAKEYAAFVVDGRNNGLLDNNPNADLNAPMSTRPNSFRIPARYLNPESLTTTDWQDAIFRTAPIQNYQLSANGGTENFRYALSGNYFDQQGIIIESGMKRYSARANVDGRLSRRLSVGMSLSPAYTDTDEVNAAGHYSDLGVIVSALSMPPDIPVYNPDGSYGNEIPATDGQVPIQNPVKIAKELDIKLTQFRLIGNLFADYELLRNLVFRVSVGADYNNYRRRYWKPSTLSSNQPMAPAIANIAATEDINWLNENTLNYNINVGNHSFNAVTGFTSQRSSNSRLFASATNFPDDLVANISGGQVNSGLDAINEWSLLSYLLRVNYGFKDKYLVTATYRADGSSRFGSANRWGSFPSVSVGWRISEEPFLKDNFLLSDAKIRASYGLSGNNAIGNYRHIGLLSETNYVLGNQLAPGLAPGTFTNDLLGWETSKQFDLGVDLGLFNNRFNLTADYYDRRNTDMLLNISVPSATGYTNAWVNLGEVRNQGVELAIGGRILTGAFKWDANFNITFNRNEVISLGAEGERIFDGAGRGNTHVTQVGRPIGSFFGHVADGIFLSQAEIETHATQPGVKVGDVRFRDINGDGVINDEDRDFIGSPLPDYFYGINNNFSFKNFTLSVFLNGMSGNDLFWGAGNGILYNFAGVQNNLRAAYTEAYRSPEEPGDGKTPRNIRGGINNNFRYSSLYIFDGSFLRVRNITLGYNLPSVASRKIGLQAARLFASVNNLHTFTSYPGYDPEVSNSGDNLRAAGLDYGGYPLPRTVTFGFNASF
jgi:TonB-linked SusC/RagA family outer membrane protein